MSIEQRWVCDRIASPGEAEGATCIFCKERIVNESQPTYWALKAVEDNQDADYTVEDGFAHKACADREQAESRRSRFELPEVPKGPGG